MFEVSDGQWTHAVVIEQELGQISVEFAMVCCALDIFSRCVRLFEPASGVGSRFFLLFLGGTDFYFC